jgi:hypothetical protein
MSALPPARSVMSRWATFAPVRLLLALAQAYLNHSRIFMAAELAPFVEAAAGDTMTYLTQAATLYEALPKFNAGSRYLRAAHCGTSRRRDRLPPAGRALSTLRAVG